MPWSAAVLLRSWKRGAECTTTEVWPPTEDDSVAQAVAFTVMMAPCVPLAVRVLVTQVDDEGLGAAPVPVDPPSRGGRRTGHHNCLERAKQDRKASKHREASWDRQKAHTRTFEINRPGGVIATFGNPPPGSP